MRVVGRHSTLALHQQEYPNLQAAISNAPPYQVFDLREYKKYVAGWTEEDWQRMIPTACELTNLAVRTVKKDTQP